MMKTERRAILQLRQATFRLGDKRVFPQTDWTLRLGEHWAVTGPTAAGKTIFARALRGDLPLVAGAIEYDFPPVPRREPEDQIECLLADGGDFDTVAGASSRWFSLDQEESLLTRECLEWSAVENINPFEVIRRRRADRERWERRAREVIRWLGIQSLLDKPVLALSNGERRKVALARALMRAPAVLILDDPFAGLDAAYREHLRNILETLIRQRATTLLVIGAQPADWPRGLTHVLRIERFRVVRQSSLAEWRPAASVCAPSAPSKTAPRPRLKAGTELVHFEDVDIFWENQRLLTGVNWTVRAGESWAIMGPNGSGKTTLLSFIVGDNPQVFAKNVRIFGQPRGSGESVWDIRKHIGWVSPELSRSCDPNLTGLETVLSGFLDADGADEAPSAKQRAQARLWLRKLGLGELGKRLFGEMSTGEQRLILLARALVKRPRLLVLDEPCQGLDKTQRERLIAEVDRRIRQGTTALYVTHRRDEIPPGMTHVLRLKNGRATTGVLSP